MDVEKMVATYICLAVALFLLWWPQWEEDRRRLRRMDRELESKRLDLYLKYGIDVRDVECEHFDEWLHWNRHGRGRPY